MKAKRMTDLRIVKETVELIDAVTNPPVVGSRVLALTIGGALVPHEWGTQSLRFYEAWCAYPKVPASVKERLVSRYEVKA